MAADCRSAYSVLPSEERVNPSNPRRRRRRSSSDERVGNVVKLTLISGAPRDWVGGRCERQLSRGVKWYNRLWRLDTLDQVAEFVEVVDVWPILVANPKPTQPL